MTPDETAELQAAQDHEAAEVLRADEATARAEEWESRALLDETEIGHLRALCSVLERTALPLLDPAVLEAVDDTPVDEEWTAAVQWWDASFAEFRSWLDAELAKLAEVVGS